MPTKFSRPRKQLPYNFLLELDGATCARFQEAAGLDTPHGVARTTLILRHGIIRSNGGLWAWRKQGNVPRRDGMLAMLDASGAVKGRWRFQGARITRWLGPTFNPTAGDVAMKILELTCEKIDLA